MFKIVINECGPKLLKMFIRSFLMCFILLPLFSYSKEVVTWVTWDFKPDFIHEGVYKNQGYVDKHMAYLHKNMPEYKHEFVMVNMGRLMIELAKPTHCAAMLWQGYMPEHLIYSTSYSFTPPYGIFTLKDKIKQFGPEGSLVSLVELLKNKELRLGVLSVYADEIKQKNSRYPVLHKFLKPYLNESNVLQLRTNTNQMNMQYLIKDRVDYVISNPMTAPTEVKLKGLKNDFVFYNLIENPYYKKIASACTNSKVGRAVIKKINQLTTSVAIMKYLEYQEEWNGNNLIFRNKTIDYFIKKQTEDLNVIE